MFGNETVWFDDKTLLHDLRKFILHKIVTIDDKNPPSFNTN